MPAQTLAERILSEKAGHPVRPGEVVDVEVDVALTHEVLGPPTFKMFEELGVPLWDPAKVFVTIDHFVPAATADQANNNRATIEAVERHGITGTAFYDGPSHQTLAESGMVRPGMVVVGTDSHTCTAGALGAFGTGIGSTEMAGVFATGRIWFRVPAATAVALTGTLPRGVYAKDVVLHLLGRVGVAGFRYESLEFGGPGLRGLPMDERIVLANMAVELGAKVGLLETDAATAAFLDPAGAPAGPAAERRIDPAADYGRRFDIDLGDLGPMVARPHSVDNVVPVAEAAGSVRLQQAFLGSCTGGRLTDYRNALEVLDGHTVHPDVRLIVTPASKRIYRQMLVEGMVARFAELGAMVMAPSCGACAGLQGGVLGDGENVVSSSNRNFVGRMGNPGANVFLASPATVAASAITGTITDPRTFL
ncbi:3-isopropylmalate dehydratase large subunit [Actinomadura macrotermitis]|uniref:3-isopropylmalate dehydratase large subunit n=1 Tax=Actinomadura macrotermitis TaxID=2585200 RepID=A0A7K0BRH3_9ACTN|nr:aconitase/3-isopropylmalate dehydratase large subunit family protein [Actinomadura macrotermitis]MQY03727.1 3-isopropylmalate dehydratase large subunit [Actinomadura macrotermitis]